MASCPPCNLTSQQIDNLPDDDPDVALDLLEAHSINDEGVGDTAEARTRLREHLEKQTPVNFKCTACELTQDDINDLTTLSAGTILLREHFLKTTGIDSLDMVKATLQTHLQLKEEKRAEEFLPKYDIDEVAKVVRKVVEENRKGRVKLLDKLEDVKQFVAQIPEARKKDIYRQLPSLDEDLVRVHQQLEKDNCTIMIAGETGAGKSCLLNLLLGELTHELMSVNNLPSTSAMCEIKYGKQRLLKAYPVEGDDVKTIALDQNTAPQVISDYTSQRNERTDLEYKKVEVFWPCEWIKDGITITDTPGVGESDELTQMVKDYIPSAFGFIYVINTPNAGGINPEELEDLLFYHITKEGIGEDPDMPLGQLQEKIKFDPRSAIFICNKWDQVPTDEREEVKDYVKKKLQKVWKDFDFDNQVFFISATKTIEELKGGYVSKEFRRLLLGIQNLLPVGFRSKMESQFWKLFNVMDRCTWVLKNYILCDDEKDKKEKKLQYAEARKRLSDLEKRPELANRDMKRILEEEVDFAISRITEHMQSEEVQKRLSNWKESECPDNDNLDRLHKLQNAYAQRRIKQEINRFEQEQGIFEEIQKKIMNQFQSIFVSLESELASVENGMKEEPEFTSLMATYYNIDSVDMGMARKASSQFSEKPIWVPLGVVIGAFALPFVKFKNMHKHKVEKNKLASYRKDKMGEMARITTSCAEDLIQSHRLREVIEEKLQLLKRKFGYLVERIPGLIEANQRLLSSLEKELDQETDFKEYIPLYHDAVAIQDNMNYVYMCDVRTFDIDMVNIVDMKKIGEGAFAVVYRGMYIHMGKSQVVAVKRLKESLSESNVTDFLVEELNLTRIQAPNVVKYLGTSVKRNGDTVYPVMIQEYCSITFDKILYNRRSYRGPGSVSESDPVRPELLQRAARYADEICKGLAVMHRLGFVHRDMKPENILVDRSSGVERVKLCDLGITKREIDITKTVAGTPLYMAPEIQKQQKYDRTVDIFSLGLLFWEIWYGAPIEQMYTIDNYKTFVKNPFRKNPPPESWSGLMSRCWAENPKLRPRADECSAVFSQQYKPDPLNSAMKSLALS